VRYLKRFLVVVLATLGVLMCLLCAVVDGVIPVYCSYQTDSQIAQLFVDMFAAIQREDYAAAFQLMSPAYQQSRAPNDLRHWPDSMFFRLQPHYYLEMIGDQAKVYPRSCKAFDLMSGPIFDLVRIDNIWYFTGEYDWPLD
jgi:hypothetical protein